MGVDDLEIILLEDTIWVATRPTGLGVYDFSFETFLACRHPFRRPPRVEVVARLGAFQDYEAEHAALAERGLALVHTPEDHRRATRLPVWYPLLADLTPRSLVFDGAPDPRAIASELGFPVFMKGERQTSRHKRSLSIIDDEAALERALEERAKDTVLSWQRLVFRKLERLRPVEDVRPDRIPSSFEFRTFFWRGRLVGFGRYWFEGRAYAATPAEEAAAVAVAGEAARRIDVRFLVVDVAQTVDGRWIVIEVNDGQESGYAGIEPLPLWRAVIAIESERARG